MKLQELNEAAKKPEKKPRKLSAASYNKMVVDAIKGAGFKVKSRERTQGALKTWMTGEANMQDLTKALRKTFKKVEFKKGHDSIYTDEIRGDGWKIEKQGGKQIFVAVYGGPRADEYAMGLDV